MPLSPRSALMLGASILALSHPALAQETGETTVLDTITITADADRSAVAGAYVATGAQIATKTTTPLAETQQSISVVTSQQIIDQGAQTLGQALSYTAGVLGEPFGADPRFDSPTVRGFEARSSQYVNGLRQLRHMGAPAYETYGLQQVEVLRGPNSSLYGAGSPSGIINQVQKRAQSGDFGEVGIGYDSNDASQIFFDMNRAPSETLSWRLTGIGRNNKEQIEDLTNKRGYLAGAVRWNPDDATTFDFIASYTKDSPISPPGVPFALTQMQDGKDLRKLYAGEPGFDDSDRKMYNAGIELSHQFDNGWTLSQGFRYEKFDWEYTGHYVSDLAEDGASITRGANYQLEDTSGINLDTRLTGEVFTGAATHQLLVGLDIRRYEADTTTRFFTAQPLNWRDPVYGDHPAADAWYTSISDVTLKQVGLYMQDEISLDNWRGSVALRHDWTEQKGSTFTNFAGPGIIDQSDNATTGRLGLSYVFANGAMPYVSYSTSFDPEIGVDDSGNQLKPTEGKQWEVGLKYQPAGFEGLFTAAIYDLMQENLTRNMGAGVVRQIGEVKSKGVELEATAELANGWDLRAGYAYNKTEQVGGEDDGREMPNAPRHMAGLWLDRDFHNGFRIGAGIRHIGARKGDIANTYEMGGVTLLDLGATYTRDNVEASLNISNLADKVYLSNCGSFGCYYGEGRTVTATLAYKW